MMSNNMNLLPAGTRIGNGRYEILEVIGQGGFGVTYRGIDRRLEVSVAIKEYYPSGIASRYVTQSLDVQVGGIENRSFFEKGKKKFLEEARVLARFSDDPNVVSVRDFFEDNDTVYIVMEYLQGESLQDYTKRVGPLPFEDVFTMFRPVMQSLARIHNAGLIHRDISPSNMILLRNGRIKLIDFGTAREASPEGEKSLSVVLKPGFAPVEQYQSRGGQGPWSDVYALCASIYRLITGKIPENSLTRVMYDELLPPSQLGAEIAPDAEQVLMQGMAIQAGSRIQNMEQLEEEFDRALAAADEVTVNGGIFDEDDEVTVMGPGQGHGSAGIFSDLNTSDGPAVGSAGMKMPAGSSAVTDKRPGKGAKEKEAGEKAAGGKSDKRLKKADKVEKAGKAKKADESKNNESKHNKSKKKKKSGSGIKIAAIALVVILLGGIGIRQILKPKTENISKYSDGSKEVSFSKTTVTTDMIKEADRDSKINKLRCYRCIMEDDVIEAIGDMKHIERIDIYACSGYSTLTPLSGLETLTELKLDGSNIEYGKEDQILDSSQIFTEDLPGVTNLNINHYQIKDLAFLQRFSSLNILYIIESTLEEKDGTFPAMPAITDITIEGTDVSGTDFSSLGQSKDLREVDMTGAGLKTISFLSGAAALEEVTVSNNQLTTLEGLENKSGLHYVYADYNKIADISALDGNSSIRILEAAENQITDITTLATCPDLTGIKLPGNKIEDIAALGSCTKLNKLDIENNKVSDLSALGSCPELVEVILSGNQVSDASPLIVCEKIRNLEVNRNKLKDLAFCEKMINLIRLEAGENEIADLSGLHNVTQLEDVRLADNKISDISVLDKSADKIKNLVLDKNPLSDIGPLSKCGSLYALSMNECQITSLKDLATCPTLYYLSAYGNKIKSLDGLESCPALYAIDLGENEISDIKALEAMASGDMVLLLQNNKLKDIKSLNIMKNYFRLSLYGNEIKDLSPLSYMDKQSRSIITGVNKVYIDWVDGTGGAGLAEISFKDPNVIDVPLDQQVNVKSDFQEARKEMDGGSMYDEPVYLSKEEADAEIADIRKEARRKAGLEEEDPEEETDEETDEATDETTDETTDGAEDPEEVGETDLGQ